MCETKEITLKEAQRNTLDALNVIVNQYKDNIEKELMNKVYELISKLVFCSSIDIFIIELDELNEIMKNITEEILIKCKSVDWFEEVKKRVLNKNMFASELIVPDILNYEERYLKYSTNIF